VQGLASEHYARATSECDAHSSMECNLPQSMQGAHVEIDETLIGDAAGNGLSSTHRTKLGLLASSSAKVHSASMQL
jgi:hypothetical protein